jgi:hypothetical protein
LILVIFVLFIATAFFAFFLKKYYGKVVREEDVFMVSSSYMVTVKDNISVSDDFGKKINSDNGQSFGYVELEISNSTSDRQTYQLYVTELDNDKEINPNYVKFYLTDENDVSFLYYSGSMLPSFVDLNYLMDKPSSKLLYTGTLEGNKSKKFKLRVWLTDSYVVEHGENTFQFEIGVRAV